MRKREWRKREWRKREWRKVSEKRVCATEKPAHYWKRTW